MKMFWTTMKIINTGFIKFEMNPIAIQFLRVYTGLGQFTISELQGG